MLFFFSLIKFLISATFAKKCIHHKQPLAMSIKENWVKTKITAWFSFDIFNIKLEKLRTTAAVYHHLCWKFMAWWQPILVSTEENLKVNNVT